MQSIEYSAPPEAATAPLSLRGLLLRLAAWLEAHPVLLGAACIVPLLAKALAMIPRKPAAFDEIFTLVISKLSPAGAWNALLAGADNQPPFYYWLNHSSLAFVGNETLGLRFWSMLGAVLVSVCLYLIAGQRLGWIYGALAVMIARLSEIEAWTWEARPYALVSGAIALATLGWMSRERAARWPLVCFAVGLTLAASLHYFAILAWIPFAAGQAIADRERGRIDLPVWGVMAVAAIPWAAQLLAMQEALRQYSGHFWEPPSASRIVFEFYRLLDGALLVFVPFFFAWVALRRPSPERSISLFSRAELTFLALLASAPMWTYLVLSRAGAYGFRYFVYSVLGWAIVIPMLFRFAEAGVRGITTAAVVVTVPLLALGSARAAVRGPSPLGITADYEQLRRYEPGKPVLMPEPLKYVEAQFHAPADLKNRLVYPLDRERSIRFNGKDTGILSVQGLSPLLGLNTPSYDSFFKDRNEVLIWQSKNTEFKSWIPATLMKEGWSIQWRTEWSQTEVLLARRSAP
ncbi:MAG: glycosyltransferase family 39 protein [Bryobacteraceae bacterium]